MPDKSRADYGLSNFRSGMYAQPYSRRQLSIVSANTPDTLNVENGAFPYETYVLRNMLEETFVPCDSTQVLGQSHAKGQSWRQNNRGWRCCTSDDAPCVYTQTFVFAGETDCTAKA